MSRSRDQAYSMRMIYESDAFLVVHTRYSTGRPGRGWADIFEVIDRQTEHEIVLQDDLSDLMQSHIRKWRRNVPDQDEVETLLAGFASMANIPILTH